MRLAFGRISILQFQQIGKILNMKVTLSSSYDDQSNDSIAGGSG